MGTADHRSTRFEIKSATQDANGLTVQCTERGVYGSAPPARLITDLELSSKDLDTVVAALTILETAFAAQYAVAEQSTTPATVHALLRQEEDAKARVAAANAEASRIEAENIVKRAEVEQLDADLATIRAAGVTEVVP